ncbi:SEC7-like protein [Ceratobasidium sp. AG-I]|nr:SEC7-like protein [Ceratobasidium sp. AG-I]
MPLWSSKLKLSSNFSKSSVALVPEARGSPIYHDPSSKAQGTSSELHLDQQHKLKRLKSKPSRLSRSTKPPSSVSTESFHTADQASEDSQPRTEDATLATPLEKEDTAKTFADRAWNEDPTFVEREKLVEWLGSPTEIRQRTLTQYIAHFDFSDATIDQAIRQLCEKLYIKGETQQIDRILDAFSEHYMFQNPGSTWKHADIVHVITFAIILLNTDLQAPELNAHMTSSQFVENTVETIRTQMQENVGLSSPGLNGLPSLEPLSDIDELPQPQSPVSPVPQSPTTPTLTRTSSPPNGERERRAAQHRKRLSSIGSVPFINRDSWVLELHSYETGENAPAPAVLEERWISDVTSELTAIYNRIRSNPILQSRQDDPPMSPQTKGGMLKRGSVKIYHSLRGESPYAQSAPSASGGSFVSALGHRMTSSMSSLPHFLGLTSNQSLQSSTTTEPSKSIDSKWAKSGQLTWKSIKPTVGPGRVAKPKRWLNVFASIVGTNLELNGPAPGNNPGTGRRQGVLSLLHTLAVEMPAPKGSKVRSFGLTLASGETHIFEIQSVPPTGASTIFKTKAKPTVDADAEVVAWVRACNYHAARFSRAPLPDGVSNVEYGWNGATISDDDQSSIDGRGRSVSIDDWVTPTMPGMESEADVEGQLVAWNRQVEACDAEFTEHGEMRGRMMSLYRPGSAQAQKSLGNWEKKAQHLLTEIVKYETYAEVLKGTESLP